MAENTKRYYWLKLKEDFFDEKYVKALRKLPQGDSLAIVYLKMQLKSLKTEGIIKYEGIMPDAMTELSLLLDEDENVVNLAVSALIRFGVVERWDNDTFYLVALQQLIGSETQGAERVRKHRALKQAQQTPQIETNNSKTALQCNGGVTECNTEKEIEIDIEKREDIYIPPLTDKPPTTECVIRDIVEYLNNKAGTKYRASTAATKKHINARISEGFNIDDFKSVIDKKCAEWRGSTMEKYIRPETLFGAKFESYLNQNITVTTAYGANGIKLSNQISDDLDGIL